MYGVTYVTNIHSNNVDMQDNNEDYEDNDYYDEDYRFVIQVLVHCLQVRNKGMKCKIMLGL